MFEYIAPVSVAVIGPWASRKLQSVKIVSSRLNPTDTAEIYLPSGGVATGAIKKGMPVNLSLGYIEKGLWTAYSGAVEDISWGRIIAIYCRDKMERLRQTKITQSFIDATPQDVLQFALRQAGIEQVTLSSQVLPRKHHFIACGVSVIQLIKLVNSTWELEDWAFYFEPNDAFYWGPWQESGRYNGGQPMAALEYGRNILDLQPSDHETGVLKTFSLPFIRHSHLLILKDKRFWSKEVLVRVERICYTHGEKATGMVIEWRIQEN